MKRCIPLLVFTIVAVLVPTAWAIEQLVPIHDSDPFSRPGDGTAHDLRNHDRLFTSRRGLDDFGRRRIFRLAERHNSSFIRQHNRRDTRHVNFQIFVAGLGSGSF